MVRDTCRNTPNELKLGAHRRISESGLTAVKARHSGPGNDARIRLSTHVLTRSGALRWSSHGGVVRPPSEPPPMDPDGPES